MNPVSVRQRIGLGLGALLSLVNVPSVLVPTPEGETGPPLVILAVGTVMGLVGLVSAVLGWRGNHAAVRVLAGTVIVNALIALPAFFVDVPATLRALVGISVLLSLATLVLLFSPERRPLPASR